MLTLLLVGLSFGVPKYVKECLGRAIDLTEAVREVEHLTGKVYKVYLSRRKRTGECLYKIKGTQGTAVINAETGELVKFFRKK
ncbi:MAG: hypothetical protein GXN96_01645 [Aquificae bacterium]|nr:hypothetical protein [Aquificota bacterium]